MSLETFATWMLLKKPLKAGVFDVGNGQNRWEDLPLNFVPRCRALGLAEIAHF